MKRILVVLAAALLLAGCSAPKNADPAIREYMTDHLSNPDTYTVGETVVIEEGTIDRSKTVNWENLPEGDRIPVSVVRHSFTYVDRTETLTNADFIFYMNPDLDVIYYVHRDLGAGPMFSLEKAK